MDDSNKNIINETFAKHLGLLHKKLNLNEETLTFKPSSFGPKVFNNYKGEAFEAIVTAVFKMLHPGETDVVFDSTTVDNAYYFYKNDVGSGKMRIVDAVRKMFKLLESEYPDFKFEFKPEGMFKSSFDCFVNNRRIAKVDEDNIEVYK